LRYFTSFGELGWFSSSNISISIDNLLTITGESKIECSRSKKAQCALMAHAKIEEALGLIGSKYWLICEVILKSWRFESCEARFKYNTRIFERFYSRLKSQVLRSNFSVNIFTNTWYSIFNKTLLMLSLKVDVTD